MKSLDSDKMYELGFTYFNDGNFETYYKKYEYITIIITRYFRDNSGYSVIATYLDNMDEETEIIKLDKYTDIDTITAFDRLLSIKNEQYDNSNNRFKDG